MAGCDRGADAGGARRPDDAGADRRYASIEQARASATAASQAGEVVQGDWLNELKDFLAERRACSGARAPRIR